MDKKDAQARAEAFESLIRHPGWTLYTEHLQKLQSHIFGQMQVAKNNEELAKHTYAYILLQQLGTAPQNTLKVLEASLANTKKL